MAKHEMSWDQWVELRKKEIEKDLAAEQGITPHPLPKGVSLN